MADQKTVNRNLATPEPPPGGLVGNIAEFGNDIATLVELQAKLATLDARECLGRATWPLIFLAAGAAVAVSCLPVLVLGIAELITLTGLASWASKLLAAGVILLVAGGVAFVAYKEALTSINSFHRSTEEFTRNLSWVRTVLVHSGRSVARPKV